MTENKLTTVSLFSGAGGSTEGLKQVGGGTIFEELLAVEVDCHAVRSFDLNHPEIPITNSVEFIDGKHMDWAGNLSGNQVGERFAVGHTLMPGKKGALQPIRETKWADFIEYASTLIRARPQYAHLIGKPEIYMQPGMADFIAASCPCQDFSMANNIIRRKSVEELKMMMERNELKNSLFFQTIDLIEEAQPKVFLIENVPGMMQGKMRRTFIDILIRLTKTRYRFAYRVLYGPHYGVKQARSRIIFIGVRKDIPIDPVDLFPEPQLSIPKEYSLIDVCKHLGFDTPEFFNSEQHIRPYIPATRIIHTITKSLGLKFYYSGNPEGQDPPNEVIKDVCGFRQSYQFYGGVTSKSGYRKAFERMGNAVPPPMMKAIGERIAAALLKYNSSL